MYAQNSDADDVVPDSIRRIDALTESPDPPKSREDTRAWSESKL